MLPLLVLVLISALQLCIRFPAVAGDCYDEPPNNNSYDNCATCYQTLANALVNTGDNKYQLSGMFFPIDAVTPVQVEVTYISISNVTARKMYWLKGGFYVFQPVELILYRSLFFSPPSWRKESITLELPDQCFDKSKYFHHITQRVSSYYFIQSTIFTIVTILLYTIIILCRPVQAVKTI